MFFSGKTNIILFGMSQCKRSYLYYFPVQTPCMTSFLLSSYDPECCQPGIIQDLFIWNDSFWLFACKQTRENIKNKHFHWLAVTKLSQAYSDLCNISSWASILLGGFSSVEVAQNERSRCFKPSKLLIFFFYYCNASGRSGCRIDSAALASESGIASKFRF